MEISVAKMTEVIMQLEIVEERVRRTRQGLEAKLRAHLEMEALDR